MAWERLPGHDARSTEPRRAAESLDAVARRLGAPGHVELVTVFSCWDELVGDVLAHHSWPVSLGEGTLVGAVDEPAWATQLTWLGPTLLARLGEAVGSDAIARPRVEVRPRRHPP